MYPGVMIVGTLRLQSTVSHAHLVNTVHHLRHQKEPEVRMPERLNGL
jgi:hypothetical protein